MAGHSPPPTVAAVQRRLGEQGGATLMLPIEDAAWIGQELTQRFGVARWSFALTATDANRWALRLVPRGDAAPVRAGLQLLLPRVRRRDVRHPRRRAAALARRQRRASRRPHADHARLRVQRPQGRRAPARRQAGRVRAGRARADQHLDDHDVPWSIAQLGARAELAFAPDPPRSGGASAALHDAELEDALHLFLLNRGVMITPFHNMALMSPRRPRPTSIATPRSSRRPCRPWPERAAGRSERGPGYPPRGRLPPAATRMAVSRTLSPAPQSSSHDEGSR
jgi:hypothetical protein